MKKLERWGAEGADNDDSLYDFSKITGKKAWPKGCREWSNKKWIEYLEANQK